MTMLHVKPRSKNLREIKVNTTPNTIIQDIINEYAKVNNNINPNRVRLTVSSEDDESTKRPKQIVLQNDKTVQQNNLVCLNEKEATIVYAKDLGPQISWKLVFFLEYLGPLIIHPIFYFVIFPPERFNLVSLLSYILIMLHFMKREYETFFIHVFGNSTMPLFNLFKNCFHYYFLSGVLIAGTVYSPDRLREKGGIWSYIFHVSERSNNQIIAIVFLWLIAELSNFQCHKILADLRNDGSKDRKIPEGFLFNYVTCPNYLCEILAFFSYALLNGNWSSFLFLIISTTQMYFWAVKKHNDLKKRFPQYPKNRKVLVPFVI
ncbi:hypothetical protein PACTADRAFT_35774 [Pachysolen tannophilus NRRL Y-2460]|uniref:3-oxo-5-alpha-steroid 4-dehydrogenase C-terminal domain-containing protein n=1 Tax=Pachysolen tannophilus NRRL Y-2460 TaxID=669874 RepID=A0A1E4TN93_PACTA|nr:hypothetical protein PACTADRAFT_35774 [Pachysolen tannophilus NRRL Y-2460]